jgi:hypothetical protein
MNTSILRLNDELIRSSNLDSATKQVLYRNIGRFIAAESTERGWVFFLETLSDTEKAARDTWEKLSENA